MRVREDYEVPGWVVGHYSDMESSGDDWIPSNDNNKLQTSKSKNEADTPINEDDTRGL